MGRIEPLWREEPARLMKEVQMGDRILGVYCFLKLKEWNS